MVRELIRESETSSRSDSSNERREAFGREKSGDLKRLKSLLIGEEDDSTGMFLFPLNSFAFSSMSKEREEYEYENDILMCKLQMSSLDVLSFSFKLLAIVIEVVPCCKPNICEGLFSIFRVFFKNVNSKTAKQKLEN